METRVINLKDHMHNLNGSMSGFVVPSGVHINSEPKNILDKHQIRKNREQSKTCPVTELLQVLTRHNNICPAESKFS